MRSKLQAHDTELAQHEERIATLMAGMDDLRTEILANIAKEDALEIILTTLIADYTAKIAALTAQLPGDVQPLVDQLRNSTTKAQAAFDAVTAADQQVNPPPPAPAPEPAPASPPDQTAPTA